MYRLAGVDKSDQYTRIESTVIVKDTFVPAVPVKLSA
jgi:hypothetical protein